MSTPFTDPYSDTATLQDLAGELALARSQRRHAIFGTEYDRFVDDCTPEEGKDIQSARYWREMQFFFMPINRPGKLRWVDCARYTPGTWPPPVLATHEQIWTAAGLNPQGYRRATAWDGVTEPDWQYGYIQAGDIIGPWIIEDMQRVFSVMRCTCQELDNYVFSGAETIIYQMEYCEGQGGGPTVLAARAAAEADYQQHSYYNTGLGKFHRYVMQHAGLAPFAQLASSKMAIIFNFQNDLLECPREVSVHLDVVALSAFCGFGDFPAPGRYLAAHYPPHAGATPPIVFGTTEKPSWPPSLDEYGGGYKAQSQLLIQWDFANHNELEAEE